MKKLILATVAVISLSAPAYAIPYLLTAQWLDGGNRFCKYANGSVINVGPMVCPLTIEG